MLKYLSAVSVASSLGTDSSLLSYNSLFWREKKKKEKKEFNKHVNLKQKFIKIYKNTKMLTYNKVNDEN